MTSIVRRAIKSLLQLAQMEEDMELHARVAVIWVAAIMGEYLVWFVGTKGFEMVHDGLLIAGWQTNAAKYVAFVAGLVLAFLTIVFLVRMVVKDIKGGASLIRS